MSYLINAAKPSATDIELLKLFAELRAAWQGHVTPSLELVERTIKAAALKRLES